MDVRGTVISVATYKLEPDEEAIYYYLFIIGFCSNSLPM